MVSSVFGLDKLKLLNVNWKWGRVAASLTNIIDKLKLLNVNWKWGRVAASLTNIISSGTKILST